MSPEGVCFKGDPGHAPPWNFGDFYNLKSPFLGLWVIQWGYWPDLNLESFFLRKIYLFMKTLTDFCKTRETGVDPCLKFSQWILFNWKVTPVWFCSLKLAKLIYTIPDDFWCWIKDARMQYTCSMNSNGLGLKQVVCTHVHYAGAVDWESLMH